MKIAITGADGQLGHAMTLAAEAAGHEAILLTRSSCDLLDPACPSILAALKADWVFHGAAYTAVDQAEDQPELARAVNEEGSRRVALGAAQSGAKLLYMSTDYVFDGESRCPYPVDAAPNPLNVYGRTKLAGERAVVAAHPAPLTVRTSWLMGGMKPNFASTILRLARERDRLDIVSDQRGRPTWVFELAPALVTLMERSMSGLVHLAGGGDASWLEVAQALFTEAKRQGAKLEPLRVKGTTTANFGARAPRPAYSVLDLSGQGHEASPLLPDWRTGLARAVEVSL